MNELKIDKDVAWYLVQTKPKQEFRALEQLNNQGFTCFLPTLAVEKMANGKLENRTEPLFSRYLFIQLDLNRDNWAPIRSTRGVSKLVSFGGRLATLPEECVMALRSAQNEPPKPLFEPGDRVTVIHGPFSGLEGIYQIDDGEARALILIELMNQPHKLKFAVHMLRKAA